jgi:hypothetical protein
VEDENGDVAIGHDAELHGAAQQAVLAPAEHRLARQRGRRQQIQQFGGSTDTQQTENQQARHEKT